MCEFMGQDIQAPAQVIDRACEKYLPAVVASGVRCIVDGIMVLVAEVLQDDHGRLKAISALPSDLIVVIPGSAVIVQRQQACIVPAGIVRTRFQYHISLVVQEVIAVRHDDPALDVSKIVHPRARVPHQVDGDLFLCPVGQLHGSCVLRRFHELEYIRGAVPCRAGLIARKHGRHAVEVLPVRCYVGCQIGQVRTLCDTAVRIIAVHGPHETALLRLLRRRIQLPVHGKHDLLRITLQDLQIPGFGVRRIPLHDPLRLSGADTLRGILIRKLRHDAADQSGHPVIPIRNDLDRASGDGRVRIHLLEHIIMVACRILQRAPGLKLYPAVQAERLRHRIHNRFRVLHVLHRAVAAASLHKIQTAAVCFVQHRVLHLCFLQLLCLPAPHMLPLSETAWPRPGERLYIFSIS